ncbi:uncharacterized protein LOC117329048 [Pecten maximus]|uniref:uncharacterized protein LOC117329048 n=1 Tax=Pecten maximus TaxID=6579 RepID=UPI0014589809|nr:uncharacterized protein LOC117329048 [Pecten maximus]XP_033742636.1 uncharacterized protein LOC117329048 [Pecten maximus]
MVICALPLVFITHCSRAIDLNQLQKAFVVVCFNTGSSPPNITVRISGPPSIDYAQLPNFTLKAESTTTGTGVSFLTFEGSFTYHTTCAYYNKKDKLGSYFVYFDNAADSISSTKVQVTLETDKMCDGYTAIPILNLGSEYYAVTFCEVFGECQIFIVAIDDALRITVRLPNTQNVHDVMFNSKAYGKGDTITVDLGSMETVLIECECDLTGTKITADSNVAVFSGSRNTIVGVNGNENFLLEQLPPFNRWGTEYACPCKPYCNKHGAFIRVIAKEATIIHISGYPKVKTTLNVPWIHRRIEQDDFLYITADKPVLVVMFLLSDQKHTSSMFLIPPVKDQDNNMAFQYPTDRFNKMEMIVLSPKVDSGFLLNGAQVAVSQNFHFPSSHMLASLLEFPTESRDRNIVIDMSTGGFGVIGVSTSDVVSGHTLRVGFSLGSFDMTDFNDPAPVYPGDRADNDEDGTNDEDDCSDTEYPDDDVDCSNNFSAEKDEKGYRFFVVFPFLDTPTRFTVDIMSSDELQWTNIKKNHVGTCPS